MLSWLWMTMPCPFVYREGREAVFPVDSWMLPTPLDCWRPLETATCHASQPVFDVPNHIVERGTVVIHPGKVLCMLVR